MPQPQPRRVDYPDQERFPGAFVVLPAEWLGEHFIKRDAAVRAASRFNSNQLVLAACSLMLADEWGGIPGIEGADPRTWELAKTPAVLLVWLEQVVYNDFAQVYAVPKVLPSELSDGSMVMNQPSMAGN